MTGSAARRVAIDALVAIERDDSYANLRLGTLLDRSGLDVYSQPEQLLNLFQRMQDFQIRRTAENGIGGNSRHIRRVVPAQQPSPAASAPKRRRIFPAATAISARSDGSLVAGCTAGPIARP